MLEERLQPVFYLDNDWALTVPRSQGVLEAALRCVLRAAFPSSICGVSLV